MSSASVEPLEIVDSCFSNHGFNVRPYVLSDAGGGVGRPTLAVLKRGLLKEPILTPGGRTVKDYSENFVGLDAAKDRHAVAIAENGRDGEVRYLGEISSDNASVGRLVRKLARPGLRLRFCYEAGPTGYGLSERSKRLAMNVLSLPRP
ncbi:hypothetical protein ACVIHI_008586 [Bradyrhizobium sp. USDA 4524]|nr:hypothetical protein [Bradyrhizobium sp. USDA 4538]MCP1907415.1 hypothetical protein [Bradyrhizobium sp. USDA 4537]MCP1985201.1 hypothetical protein [Bradyrhizobium sp. USDA 4539]